MNNNELLTRIRNAFPNAKPLSGPSTDTPEEKVLSFAGAWLTFRKNDLTAEQLAILQTLSDQNFDDQRSTNPWYRFLTHQTSDTPQTNDQDKQVRLIQAHFTFHDTTNTDELTESLKSLFNHIITSFFLNASTLIIVQSKDVQSLSSAELESILQTIESDFFVKVQLFLGNYWPVDQQLPLIFNEEQAVFAKSTVPVSTLSSLALDYYARPQLRKSSLAQQLTATIRQETDIQDVITAVYQNAGNLSSAAKQLFIHRNTLQYRLERFREVTGFNLKNMDDLVLCYLLITSFTD
ncbi:PucR family transcriptional regulator [Lapidilactobacillus bayanensis]|uniref:PucR family transcriptional regulator n=1 Tax=Lapidilactobacillus bayanensis TaxID=2485998 RepID=UPI000F7991BD|nr:helix-turn-helix domain-containing protein [Lapidilactobacillus bayanensis]